MLLAVILVGCDDPSPPCGADSDCGAGMRCVDTMCVAAPEVDAGELRCGGGDTLCGTECVDLPTSEAHCGACDVTCGEMQQCVDGSCIGECTSAERLCGATCVDITRDAMHCGACDSRCEATHDCIESACLERCVPTDPPTERCDGVDNDCDGSLDPVACDPDLVAWYRFDAADGDALDTAGGHDGPIEGTASRTAMGYVGGALALDAARDSAITVPDHESFAFGTAFTAEAWIFVESCANAGADHNTVAVIEGAFLFSFQPGCRVSSFLHVGGDWRNDQPVASVPTGRWVHYAFAWDGALAVHYLDGDPVSAGTAITGTMGDPAVPLRIGSRIDCACTQTFNGRIDELKLWRVGRSHADVCADAGGTFDASGNRCVL